MSRRSFVAAVGMVVLCSLQVHAQQQVVGSWFGTVPLRGGDLTLQVDITRSDSGIAAVMDIAESRLIRFPVPDSRFEQGSLVVSVPRGWGLALSRDIGLSEDERIIRFEGRPAGDSITGTLRMAYATFPLTLRRIGAAGAQVRRQDLTWSNGAVSLSGTVYLPEHGGPFPAIVFTHSSGDHTREAYAAEAQRLAGAGIAALVYDKRGAGQSQGANTRVATFDELASDAEGAVRALRSRRDIDPRRIGLFGLSQGTWLIGMVAARIPDIAFLVFVSGSGIPVWEQDVFRTGAMMRAGGFSEPDIAEAVAYQNHKFAVARTGLGWEGLDSLTKALRARPAKWFAGYAQEYSTLTSARFWWLAAFHHDPTPILERLRMPVLGLFGEKDLSFPIPIVVERMRAAFTRAGNTDVTLTVFPGAEHQLLVPQSHEGRMLRRAVTPEYMPTLVAWIQSRTAHGHRAVGAHAPNE